ncbi:C6 transcription factor, putative [Talaromyces stipitatus ATCC 10500]|uniref:C6 transcription factor, putative n=1 Tax=Talaromyces stipitatus (strain ATCC 10500 / CBS 375.48 / QM 6759 / NRRL 1006) TaxID=441959 RepID=B8MGG1_TALSN|nr:C6 transcription factor, putative [Talaromyces stipitatus ATCC 10500]EED16281.1 C6 transcription factor, putative [Talaromyces stipitatus ATCC 10500]
MADDTNMNGAAKTQPKAKRSRVQFSCTACRYRKLKCDRTHPCDRCTRRGDAASCTYVGHGPRGRVNHDAGTNPSHIQDRIQHLENLILSFAQRKRQEDEGTSSGRTSTARGSNSASATPVSNTNNNDSNHMNGGVKGLPDQRPSVRTDPGKLLNGGTTYVDSSHWQAILDDVCPSFELSDRADHYISIAQGSQEICAVEVEQDASRPTLLFYGDRVPTKQDLIADLPEREVVDRLIAKFFNSDDPMLAIIHFPTFHREYNQFWNDPSRVSLPWLAFLYGCMTMAVGIFRRSMETLPSPLGDAVDEINRFHRRCCHCLINSNYTTVGRYKVEALLINATIEYTKRGNSSMSVSIVLGIAIKLAMRMGYHRDAKHYDTLSALEGEMRRRTWAILSQLDTLTSFQVGIPKQAQSWQSDTDLPRNIHDGDFDENSIELPPSLPETVQTPATYLRSKNRIMAMFGKICDHVYSRQPSTYEKILELDRGLEEAHDLMASALRMRPMNQSFADNVSIIMKRYTLDVLYQKARIVLHRKYLVEARYNPQLSYSRSVCVTAAKEILRHQYDLYKESQVGGRLEKDAWFFRSLQNSDFVLAAMVVCLELFKNNDTVTVSNTQQQNDSSPARDLNERNKLIESLQKSLEVWKENLKHSVEARKAFYAVNVMLKKAEIDDEARKRGSQSPTQITSNMSMSSTRGRTLDHISMGESASTREIGANGQDVQMENYIPSNISTILTPPISNTSHQLPDRHNSTIQPSAPAPNLDVFPQPYLDFQSSLPGLEIIENMLDTPQNLDWHAWDGHMHDTNPSLWEEAYWNNSSEGLQAQTNTNRNGGNDLMHVDDVKHHQLEARNISADSNDNTNGNGTSKMDDSLYSLYTARGYRG